MFNMARVIFPEEAKPKGHWTKDGRKIPGSDFRGPGGANDFELTIAVVWTKNGKRIPGATEIPPRGANDVTVDLRGEGSKKQRG
jgi:hypothetical protein